MTEERVRAAFTAQAGWGKRLASPFTAQLCRLIAARADRSTAIGRRLLDWPGDPAPEADNLPARLCAGLQYGARVGVAPSLARLYPPAPPPTDDALWTAIQPLLDGEAALTHSWLDSPPQTNEVGRSAVLMAGLLTIATRFGLPLHLFELGSSAGLNLLLDRYSYDLGGLPAGDPDSTLKLRPRWFGAQPPKARVEVTERRGVDLRPAEPERDGDKLLAYVWPGHDERRDRLSKALDVAAADPPPVAPGDAADWLESTLPERTAGAVRVVMHSIAFQYFPEATKRRIEALLERLGALADPGAPIAWLRFEQEEGEEEATIRLRCWPGEDLLLGFADSHGAWVKWLATGSGPGNR
jgi:hypothetical protein